MLQDADGVISLYYKEGVRDLEDLLRDNPERLHNALLADKVIGKAAAGFMAVGGVRCAHALVMSHQAIEILQQSGIIYSYTLLVDNITQPTGSHRCPLEQIVAPCSSAQEIVDTLHRHWAQKKTAATP